MRFFQAAKPHDVLPQSMVQALGLGRDVWGLTPDDIFYHAKFESAAFVTFILAKRLSGVWELDAEKGTVTHRGLGNFLTFAEPISYSAAERYSQVYFGRLFRNQDGVVLTFWNRRQNSEVFFVPTNQDIIQEALPALYRQGLISKSEPIWVYGPESDLIYHSVPDTEPKWHHETRRDKPHYTLEGRQYSYMDLAQALHTLPKASKEFQIIADFIRSSNAPELAGLKSRLPSPIKAPNRPVWYEVMKPENLESLGSQSRIDKYWDARTSSRRIRLAMELSGIECGKALN